MITYKNIEIFVNIPSDDGSTKLSRIPNKAGLQGRSVFAFGYAPTAMARRPRRNSKSEERLASAQIPLLYPAACNREVYSLYKNLIHLKNCPHIEPAKIKSAQEELDAQHAAGKWTKRDMAADALQWSKERAASMRIADLPQRIGGRLKKDGEDDALELPYFTDAIVIRTGEIVKTNGDPLNRWEQVFIYNHMAQGGRQQPTGNWKGLVELPNTVSKMKSMKEQVEIPLIERFRGHADQLLAAGKTLGGEIVHDKESGADVGLLFRPLPRIPIMLLFWDEDRSDGFDAEVKLLFGETITEHLDIESIIFLSERLRQLLCGEK